MTNDNKRPMFGPSAVFDSATREPRSGKSALMNQMMAEIEEALREANAPNAKLYTHEEVMQAMQERIDRARDKPC